MATPASLAHFSGPWKSKLQREALLQDSSLDQFPAYPLHDPSSLITSSQPVSFELGTGASIYTNSLLPAFLKAKHEIILVTCFWARSSTLTALSQTLHALAEHRREFLQGQATVGPEGDTLPSLRIRMCFSSRSLFQKLFHTTSKDGYLYPPASWSDKLGLPSQQLLRAGNIDLEIKSLFFLPFSVMHPKFVIIDRQRAWLPSCNISWEPWLEGCISITGDAVAGLMQFYQAVWERDQHHDQPSFDQSNSGSFLGPTTSRIGLTAINSPARVFTKLSSGQIPTVVLPSSHHRNPKFRPLPWQANPTPPPTPLNYAVLRLLDMAERSIYLQTPNLTAAVVIDSLLDALNRGVNVTIVTCTNMMLIEQLVTAGTTTERCVKALIKRYDAGRKARPRRGTWTDSQNADQAIDLEAQSDRWGSLKISYYHPIQANVQKKVTEEPVQSHLKLTIVDRQYTVLGSGNMDRPSWFTSQELGVLFQSSEIASLVTNNVGEVLQGRTTCIYNSEHS